MTNSNERHVPVLLKEAIDFLRCAQAGTYVDCTLGLAGHAEAMVRQLGPAGRLIGFDRDSEALDLGQERLARVSKRVGQARLRKITLVARRSAPLRACKAGFGGWVAGRLWSEQPAVRRGAQGIQFSGRRPFGYAHGYAIRGQTAEQVVNEENEHELANLIYEYGEERRSRRIARAIVRGGRLQVRGS
jgi:16S rRNA (cytosine1402-N4)-methyltransferase